MNNYIQKINRGFIPYSYYIENNNKTSSNINKIKIPYNMKSYNNSRIIPGLIEDDNIPRCRNTNWNNGYNYSSGNAIDKYIFSYPYIH